MSAATSTAASGRAARPVIEYHRGRSFASRLSTALSRSIARPVMAHWPLSRAGMALMPALNLGFELVPDPRGVSIVRHQFDGFKAEMINATSFPSAGLMIYFHGGAFLICGTATHRRACARMSSAAGVGVLSVGYRQYPRADVKHSVADGLTAYQWALEAGFDPAQIVLGGDSAGGLIAFSVAMRALEQGLPGPAAIVAISPWLDLNANTKLAHRNRSRDALVPADRLNVVAEMCAGGAMPLDPLLSPVNGRLSDLPPTLIQVSDTEVLLYDAQLMAHRLAAAGVSTRLQIWEGQVHAFPVLGELTPESREAITEIGTFVSAMTSPRRQRRQAARPGTRKALSAAQQRAAGKKPRTAQRHGSRGALSAVGTEGLPPD